ncbi:MAG: hypothetical protein NVSMB17_18270 [Candidatus Dormibacteria bacterium]
MSVLGVAASAFAVAPAQVASAGAPAAAQFIPPVQLLDNAGANTGASEPSVKVDKDGRIFISGPVGVPTGGCPLWRVHPDTLNSRGLPYDYLGKFDTDKNGVGGGDCDIAVGGSTDTNLAVSSLSLATLTTNQSSDHGDTFHPVANSVAVQNTGVDREWNAADTSLGAVYMDVHDSANNIAFYTSVDGGYTYTATGYAIDAAHFANAQQNNHFGGMVVDPASHKIFLTYVAPSTVGNNLPENQVLLAVGNPCAATCQAGVPGPISWTDYVIYTGKSSDEFAHDFPAVARDNSGTVYAAWTDKSDVFVSHENQPGIADGSGAWSLPTRADSAGEHSTMFPWMVAGAKGNVDLVYYGSQLATGTACPAGASGTLGDGNGINNNCLNQWTVRFSQSVDGGNTFSDTPASPVNHFGSICDQGLACTVPTTIGDRSLLDFFQVDLDPQGGAVIAYESDPSVPNFTRQCTGVSATTGLPLAGRSCASLLPPPVTAAVPQCAGAHLVTDPAGDAYNPSGAGGDTSTADITDISFTNDNTAKTITTVMTIANLQAAPMLGTAFTTYNVVWTGPDGQLYATQASLPDPSGVFAYGYGPFDPSKNQVTTYHPTTGSATMGLNGTISVNIPYADAGTVKNPVVIPVAPGQTPAVRQPYGLTIAGEGYAGSGLVFNRVSDRAPNSGFGSDWSVCGPPPVIPTFGGIAPAGGVAVIGMGMILGGPMRRRLRRRVSTAGI